MSRSSRKDIEQWLREARKVGFTVGTHGTQWEVINPLTRDAALIARQPTARGLINERQKLARIGFERGMPPLLIRTAPAPAEDPAPSPVPEPAPDPQPAADTPREKEPVPKISDTARVTGRGRNLLPQRDDLAANCWMLWQAIHDEGGLTAREHEGVPGVLWRGTFANVVSEMWPSLPARDTGIRNAINNHLRDTGNMACLEPHSRPPLWWLSSTWSDTKPTRPAPVAPTRTERRLTRAQVGEDRPPAPVTTRKAAAAPPPPAEKPSRGVDAVAAIAGVLERLQHAEARVLTLEGAEARAKDAEQRNLELEHVNEALERKNRELTSLNAELQAQVDRVRDAFRALGVSA